MKNKVALCILQYSLAAVILIEAVRFALPGAAHDFARTHMPGFIRLILAWSEIVGSILLAIPKTAVRGAWILFAVFLFAILLHVLHGQYGSVGHLVIYAAAALAIALGR